MQTLAVCLWILQPIQVYVYEEHKTDLYNHNSSWTRLMTKDWKVGRVNALVKISAWNIFVSGSGENNGGLCSLHAACHEIKTVSYLPSSDWLHYLYKPFSSIGNKHLWHFNWSLTIESFLHSADWAGVNREYLMQTFMNILEAGDIDDDEYPGASPCDAMSVAWQWLMWHCDIILKVIRRHWEIVTVSSKSYGIQTNAESMGFVSHFIMTSWHQLHDSWGRGADVSSAFAQRRMFTEITVGGIIKHRLNVN